MDRRRFLIIGSATIATTGVTGFALGQDTRTRDIAAPGARPMTSVQGPYRLRLQSDTIQNIGQIRRASGVNRREMAARTVSALPNADEFLAARFQASRNLTDRQWLQQSARTLFDNQRAQTAFMNWFPTLNDQAPSRPLTNLLLNGGEGFTGPALMAYAAVGAAARGRHPRWMRPGRRALCGDHRQGRVPTQPCPSHPLRPHAGGQLCSFCRI